MSLTRQFGTPPLRYVARRRGFLASLKIQIRIIGALMMRDGSSRYGHENLGFFWVMGEPLVLTTGVMGLWTMIGATHGHSDIGVVPFALSGYTLITLWRHIAAAAPLMIRRNAGLLFHRNIRVLDILISRCLLESVSILTAFFIAYIPLALLGVIAPIRDSLLLFGAWVLHSWFSFAVGMIISGLTEISEGFERFVPPAMYLTLPLTGAFTMLYWMPENLRAALSWSPLVNSQEMFRSGLFPADIPTYWNAWYVLAWCLILTVIGLPLVAKAQKLVTME
jgi:capsular polysaccharide transport system permease protein